jgi:hypothetical protein
MRADRGAPKVALGVCARAPGEAVEAHQASAMRAVAAVSSFATRRRGAPTRDISLSIFLLASRQYYPTAGGRINLAYRILTSAVRWTQALLGLETV